MQVELEGGKAMIMKQPFRINMQFFADGGASDGASTSVSGVTSSESSNTGVQGAHTTNTALNNSNASQSDLGANKTSSIEQLIQSAVDRATNKIGNENKQLRAQLDELMKQKMTDEERIELERTQERERFEQEKAQFIQEKHQLYAITALGKADLSVESDKLETLVSLVMGADETEISNNVKALSDIVKSLVASKVESTFKENGRNPAGSGNPDSKNKKNKGETIAEKLGQERAEKQKKSREILDKYTRR